MKISIEVGIDGVPTRLNLRAKLLYGENNQYEHKIFKKGFSLDKGGKVELPMDFFTKQVKVFSESLSEEGRKKFEQEN